MGKMCVLKDNNTSIIVNFAYASQHHGGMYIFFIKSVHCKDLQLAKHRIKNFFVNFQVIRIPETSDETFNNLLAFGKAMGKTTVNCKVIHLYLTITAKENRQAFLNFTSQGRDYSFDQHLHHFAFFFPATHSHTQCLDWSTWERDDPL